MDPVREKAVEHLLYCLPDAVTIKVHPDLDHTAAAIDQHSGIRNCPGHQRRHGNTIFVVITCGGRYVQIIAEGRDARLTIRFSIGLIAAIAKPWALGHMTGTIVCGQCWILRCIMRIRRIAPVQFMVI